MDDMHEAGDDRGIRERLIRAGLLKPGAGSAAAILESPPLELPISLSEALAEARADRLPRVTRAKR